MSRVGVNLSRHHLLRTACVLITTGCLDLDYSRLPDQISECENCTQKLCLDELDACLKSESCQARYQKLLKCGKSNPECRIGVLEEHPRLAEDMIELDICRSSNCMDACDECGASMFDARGAACTRCMSQIVSCSKTAACASLRGCNAAIRGRMSCNDPYCAKYDGQPYDGSYTPMSTPAREVLEDYIEKCNTECGLGMDFECAGNYTVPKPENPDAGTTIIQLDVRNIPANTPVSSVQMTIVEDINETQTQTMEESPTDEGLYEYSTTGAFTGFVRAYKQGYFPSTYYFSRPLIGYEKAKAWFFSETLLQLIDPLDVTFDTVDRGAVMAVLVDCTGTNVRGSSIYYSKEETHGDIVKFYIDDINLNLLENDNGESTMTIMLNVPTGPGFLKAEVAATGKIVSYFDIEIRPGEISFVVLYPLQL